MIDERPIGDRYRAVAGELNERQRRIWAGAEAVSHGRGGQAAVIRPTGLGCGEGVQRDDDPWQTLLAGVPQGLVDGVLDRRGAQFGARGSECLLVQIHEVFRHGHPDYMPRRRVYICRDGWRMTARYTVGMTTQIAVKLPDGLVSEIDRLVAGGAFDSRSQAVRTGLEALVAGHKRQEVDRRYRDAMTKLPETDEEMVEATRLAVDAINDEPWERWW